MFGDPLIVNPTFTQTEFVFAKSDFVHIMHFHETKCLIVVKFKNIGH